MLPSSLFGHSFGSSSASSPTSVEARDINAAASEAKVNTVGQRINGFARYLIDKTGTYTPESEDGFLREIDERVAGAGERLKRSEEGEEERQKEEGGEMADGEMGRESWFARMKRAILGTAGQNAKNQQGQGAQQGNEDQEGLQEQQNQRTQQSSEQQQANGNQQNQQNQQGTQADADSQSNAQDQQHPHPEEPNHIPKDPYHHHHHHEESKGKFRPMSSSHGSSSPPGVETRDQSDPSHEKPIPISLPEPKWDNGEKEKKKHHHHEFSGFTPSQGKGKGKEGPPEVSARDAERATEEEGQREEMNDNDMEGLTGESIAEEEQQQQQEDAEEEEQQQAVDDAEGRLGTRAETVREQEQQAGIQTQAQQEQGSLSQAQAQAQAQDSEEQREEAKTNSHLTLAPNEEDNGQDGMESRIRVRDTTAVMAGGERAMGNMGADTEMEGERRE